MKRHFVFSVLMFLLATALPAVEREKVQPQKTVDGGWIAYRDADHCFGGEKCGGKSEDLRVRLERRQVYGIRFRAHDDIGSSKKGKLRVRIDSTVIRDDVDILSSGSQFEFAVEGLRGDLLIFEARRNDEIEVSQVEVLYGREGGRDDGPRRPPKATPGWKSYEDAGACIGGERCSRNGTRIVVNLDRKPVRGVRFWAHDDIGSKSGGKLDIRLDGEVLASYVDVERRGGSFEYEVDGIVAERLTIEAVTRDEVEVSEIEVLYGGKSTTNDPTCKGRCEGSQGGCIGGDRCGGSTARVRVHLENRPVQSVSFYGHDDVGSKHGGKARVRIDDQVLVQSLDILKDGDTYVIDALGFRGDYLYIEAATADEIIVTDVKVRYR